MSKPSTALQKIFDYRDSMNHGRLRIVAKDFSSVVYFYTNGLDDCCAIGYSGRAVKPTFNYRYKSEQGRANSVARWMQSVSDRVKSRKEYKQAPRDLEVGNILSASWGYDQTNVNYYLITRLVGNASVELVEIGRLSQDTDFLNGVCIPDPTRIISDPMTRRAKGNRVRISDCISASKLEPKIVAGCEVYTADRYSQTH